MRCHSINSTTLTRYSDILAFFQGAPDGSSPGRDDLAKEIAEQGLTFTEDRWR